MFILVLLFYELVSSMLRHPHGALSSYYYGWISVLRLPPATSVNMADNQNPADTRQTDNTAERLLSFGMIMVLGLCVLFKILFL